MGEAAYNSLPIILVSAKDNVAASYIISEIIDNDATESYKAKEGDIVQERVWRIVNKYYTADVRLRECGDEQLPIGDEPVDAHIIYLQEDECTVSSCSRRAVGGSGVRLVLSARAPAAVRAWCAARRYELVPLAREDEVEDEDEVGAGRARAALHAHPWRGLVRTDRPRPTGGLQPHADSDEESSVGSLSSGSEAGVERAELVFAALAALPDAAAAVRAAGCAAGPDAGPAAGPGDRELRLARAEALLAEFCRALGHDLDDC